MLLFTVVLKHVLDVRSDRLGVVAITSINVVKNSSVLVAGAIDGRGRLRGLEIKVDKLLLGFLGLLSGWLCDCRSLMFRFVKEHSIILVGIGRGDGATEGYLLGFGWLASFDDIFAVAVGDIHQSTTSSSVDRFDGLGSYGLLW